MFGIFKQKNGTLIQKENNEELNIKKDYFEELKKEREKKKYLQLFFLIINDVHREKNKEITELLNGYSINDLQKIAIDILGVTMSFLRYSSEYYINGYLYDEEMIEFYHAVVWHLSDSTHNLPASIFEDKMNLILYISEFFEFCIALEKIGVPSCDNLTKLRYDYIISFKNEKLKEFKENMGESK